MSVEHAMTTSCAHMALQSNYETTLLCDKRITRVICAVRAGDPRLGGRDLPVHESGVV
jgi:hypothetical protein